MRNWTELKPRRRVIRWRYLRAKARFERDLKRAESEKREKVRNSIRAISKSGSLRVA